MKIVKHLLILTLGLSFVACSGTSDKKDENKDENNGKIIEKPESACDCAKNAVIVLEDFFDEIEEKDNLNRTEFERIAKDWQEDLMDSKWFEMCTQEFKSGELERLKNCEASKQLKRLNRKFNKIERRFLGKEEEKREEYKGGEEDDGSEYDGSEYEGSEYDGPADAPDAYDGE
jgi:hypothetical protein